MTQADRPALRRLAEACGIESVWTDGSGARRETSDATREALLGAFGVDASSEERAERAIDDVPPEVVEPAERSEPSGSRAGKGRRKAFSPRDADAERVWGIWTNLYSLRDRRNAGFGDLSDLGRLVGRAAKAGADFVGLNPLHALWNRRDSCSPYSPVSRTYRNPLYLDVERIPELRDEPDVRARLASDGFERRLEALRRADMIDYPAVAALKLELLRPLHRVFRQKHGAGETARGRAYLRYREERGRGLDDFATFVVLDATRRAADGPGAWWRTWPSEWRDRDSDAVREFRETHDEAVDFERWLQFELDRQLGAVHARALRAGMRIGLYQDLAVGSPIDSADAWSDPELFAFGATLGAPPDGFAADGQVWALPPWNPLVLRERGVLPWRALLREAMRHGGALRIDHVIGLVRPFLVPEGKTARDGAPVRFPAGPLFAALAEESRAAGTVVVGEDLGTVPPGLEERMRGAGVLSCRVFVFERTDDGDWVAPSLWPKPALLTTSTHDHVPLPGWWEGEELRLHRTLGMFDSDEALDEAIAGRRADGERLAERLVKDGDLAPGKRADRRAIVEAVHRRLLRSPCEWVGLSLDDLADERLPINVPGVPPDRHPSWSRRMSRPASKVRLPRAAR